MKTESSFKWFFFCFALVAVVTLVLGVAFYGLAIGILYKIFAGM